MTLRRWLEENKKYDEAECFTKNGNYIWLFNGDDDPAYDAEVISVTDHDEWGCAADVVIDYERE